MQAQIIELLRTDARTNSAGLALIIHDLAVVAGLADRILVCTRGVGEGSSRVPQR